jgi:AraC-like DNA-binding protein
LSFNEIYLIIREIMQAQERTATISSTLLRMLSAYASGKGIDAQAVFAAAGLDASLPDAHTARVRGDVFNRVWNEVASLSGDKDFGLHFAEDLQYVTTSHILFVVVMNCPTVGSALDALARYHNLMNDALRPRIVSGQGQALLGWEITQKDVRFGRHADEALLCVLNSVFVRLTEDSCRPVEVRFGYGRPNDVSEHARIFRAPLRFSQKESALVLAVEDLAQPVRTADSGLLKTLEGYAQGLIHDMYLPDTWSDRVMKTLSKMNGRRPTIDAVAKELAVGVRSLQKKLKEEGTTFTELLDRARKDLVHTLLEDPEVSFIDMAFLLGFSEQSAFNHAFRRWTGSTPKSFRRGRV